jgi:serine/threonine protein kinase
LGLLAGLKSLLGSDFPPEKPFLHEMTGMKEIAGGAMSAMFSARHRQTGQQVIVKKVTPTTDVSRNHLKREIKITLQMNHPNVVKVYGYEKKNDSYFIMMEHVPGASFRDYMKNKITFQGLDAPFLLYPQFVQVFLQAADALKHIHMMGILHLDIKPENIMFIKPSVDEEHRVSTEVRKREATKFLKMRRGRETRIIRPDNLNVKIIDFGVAVFEDELTDNVGGSAFYAAPEIVADAASRKAGIGQRSDIYSLGATFYELATGRPPYLPAFFDNKEKNWNFYWHEYLKIPRETRAMYESEMLAGRTQNPPSIKRIMYLEELRQIIAKCIELSIPKRYSTTFQLVRDLKALRD